MTLTVNQLRGRIRSRQRVRGVGVALLLLAVATLAIAWVYELTYRPRLTPIFVAVVTDYAWPVDPNPWAREDLELLSTLHKGTLNVHDMSSEWRSRDLAIRRLDSELASFVAEREVPETVVFYFSQHGLVDGEGVPYLLPNDASPIEPRGWIPLSEVADKICSKLPARVKKLVILDCNRTAMNWRIGQLHNTFADRIASVIDPKRHPGLVILNSTSPNQVGWSSPSLTGSLFGRLVTESLATSDRQRDRIADRVSLRGLVDEVNREMANWTAKHALPPQIAMLIPADTPSFPITWSLSRDVVKDLFRRRTLGSNVLIPSTELDSLWRQVTDLKLEDQLGIIPEKVNEIEHRLLSLERFVNAGSAYAVVADQLRKSVDADLKELAGLTEGAQTRGSPVAIRGRVDRETVAGRNAMAVSSVVASSLELSATLGSVSADTMDKLERQGQDLVGGVTSDKVAAMIKSLDEVAVDRAATKPSDTEVARLATNRSFETAQLLRLMTRYQSVDRWTRRDMISWALRLREWNDRLAVMKSDDGRQDIRATDWVKAELRRCDQQRALLEDLVLAGEEASKGLIDEASKAARESTQVTQARVRTVIDALRTSDLAAQRLPYIANALAELAPPEPVRPDEPASASTTPSSSASTTPSSSASTTPSSSASGSPNNRGNRDASDASSPPSPSDRSIASRPDATPAQPIFFTLVLPGIRDLLTLSQQLDVLGPGDAPPADGSLPFTETATRLATTLTTLEKLLAARIAELLRGPDSGAAMLSMRLVMDLPWLDWEERRDLRTKHNNILKTLTLGDNTSADTTGRESLAAAARRTIVRTFSSPGDPSASPSQLPEGGAASQGPAGGPTAEDRRYLTTLEELLSWPVHPMVLLSRSGLSADDAAGDGNVDQGLRSIESGLSRVEKLGATVRQSLAYWTGDARSNPWDDPAFDIKSWRTAARWQRRMLPFVAPHISNTPTDVAWRDAVQRLLLCHAQRSLESFIGSPIAGADRSSAPLFFDLACDQSISLIELFGAPSEELRAVLGDLRGRQAARRLAARSGVVTDTKLLPLMPAGTAAFEVIVSPSRPANTPPIPDMFPGGKPSVWVTNEQNQLATGVTLLDFPLDKRAELKLTTATDSPRLMAMTMFRGHEFPHRFTVNRLGGTIVDYQPYAYGPSSITLIGQRRKRVSIMFVLDCSQSMDQPLKDESGSSSGPSKLDVAKSTLVTMLDDLSRQEGARVGVILLGHRIAWTRSDPPQLSKSPGNVNPVPADLSPSQDVETILPLGRFDAGAVLKRLDTVRAWGQTPLNLALVEAMKAFRKDDPDTEKNIIVISDGRDYQFTPSRSDIPQPPKTTQSDVVRAASGAKIPIFVVGFGLPADERDQAEAEYRQLAQLTGGETVSVNDSQSLLREIREQLASGSFTVDEPILASPTGETKSVNASLNGTIAVDPRTLADKPVTLVFESASEPIRLVGGEAIKVQLSPNGQNFLPVPFTWQLPQTYPMVSGTMDRNQGETTTDYLLRAHRPELRGDSVTFPVSVQSSILPVTARPSDAWLVVTPLVNGVTRPGGRYWFYDANYEPNQPVPLLKWEARAWPKEARSARLEFWCRFDPTPSLQEFTLRDILDHPERYVDMKLADFPSIALQFTISDRREDNADYVLNVIQRHEDASPDLGQLRIEFRHAKDYRPLRVTHQFDAANRIVSHTYRFAAADAAALERSPQSRFAITTRSQSQSGAIRPASGPPIDVEIYTASDLISTDTPR
jgi:hypothetical protein